VASLLFGAVAATPVAVLGCRNRGLLALGPGHRLRQCLCTLYTAIKCGRCSHRHDPQSTWWLLRTLILAIPPVALIILA
jgi:hypothetical protein